MHRGAFETRNPFHWSETQLNLPGDKDYDPRRPKLNRLRKDTDSLTSIIVSYVDDMQAAAASAEDCWQVMHMVSSKASFLGIQVATRKTRPPSHQPGPWAGAMVILEDDGVGVKATTDKWLKTKELLRHTNELLGLGQPIDRKLLESYRGSLVYLQRTYPAMTPYVKGFHLTIDGWRQDRNSEGWKVAGLKPGMQTCSLPPSRVTPVPRLKSDVEALLELFRSDEPPIRWVRGRKISKAVYSFADASGAGYGQSLSLDNVILYPHGIWDETTMSQSSNFRELSNLVHTLEEGVKSGTLLHTKVWIFTDNTTAEGVFWKGHSPNPLLNELALRLRVLEMDGSIRIQMVHVPGTRMIQQGTDGLSRGDLTEGVMAGSSMLEHVPLKLSALERQPRLQAWMSSWLPSPPYELSPGQWSVEGHGCSGGTVGGCGVWHPVELHHQWYLWAPPPVLGDIAMEELEASRHKRSHLSHVIIFPRLMTFAWRKKLFKLCDVVTTIPPGSRSFWPALEHEPLILGLTLRFCSHSPWQVKQSSEFLALAGSLQGLWAGPEGPERHLLRQLCNAPEWMGGV
jgi:hypothetical protein